MSPIIFSKFAASAIARAWIFCWALFLPLLGACAPVSTPQGECVGTANLTVAIGGFRNSQGVALVSVFRSSRGFPDETSEAVANRRAMIANRRAMVVFEDLPCGIYAVTVHHDENDNGRMDRNWLGIPREGHGASKDPQGLFGPPNFPESSFLLTSEDLTVKIFLRYIHRKR
ncbi:hypothetical protein DSOUD_2070 [Desulfuromonas soudanensis]|uniref:DUF2141 domain-containing protein n=1 Tax=Desulfuromonas soudanensis TaxID=1603606 RepID=A0A0M4DI57_9BACT|nr:DUF2141 domain-containing protein [Desulfuromonas soudanensis]ALC16837.1 hypothetical protein DSOUD_2070 [Desulfuromonas soudanensis]